MELNFAKEKADLKNETENTRTESNLLAIKEKDDKIVQCQKEFDTLQDSFQVKSEQIKDMETMV